MGWQKGKKRGQRKSNGGDEAVKEKAAPIGHNKGPVLALTDEEERALHLSYLRQFQWAKEAVEEAKSQLKAITDRAKSELGKGALANLKDLDKMDSALVDKHAVVASMNRTRKLASWLGMPIGLQAELFPKSETSWEDEGYTAGVMGDMCSPPNHLGITDQQSWMRGWHSGQAILVRVREKMAGPTQAEVPHTDTSHQPFREDAWPPAANQ